MDKPDATELGRRALKLGLLTSAQLEEARDESGAKNPDPQVLVRVLERKGYLTPFQSGKLLKGDADGYFLGGYRLLYRISSGSFGRVFRAEDPSSGRIVAVKVLRKRWSEDPKTVELFYREAKLGISLRQANIVEILTVNQDPASKQHYIVMEFVEGGNLREFLQIRKKLPVAEALHLIEEATKGLVYAFARGITHRDMKLTNVLISSQGVAKLVDFGLAQVSVALSGRGNIGSATNEDADADHVDRTVDYAGLERATGAAPGDTRSDIYFLGCTLYELLTGRSPLEMTKDARLRMDKKRFENVKSIPRDEIEAPASVFNLVETMMSLSPQRRYQTPTQLLEAIRAARRDVEGGGTSAKSKKEPGGTGQEQNAAPAAVPRSIFIIEKNEKAQEKLREKFKELGYRVFMASDPLRALERFRTLPFDALVINAGSVGEEGLYIFNNVMDEAKTKGLPCAGVLILAAEQVAWQTRITERPGATAMTPPVTIKNLCARIGELIAG